MKTISELARELRAEPTEGTLSNVLEGLRGQEGPADEYPARTIQHIRDSIGTLRANEEETEISLYNLLDAMHDLDPTVPNPTHAEIANMARQYIQPSGGRRRRVKTVRKTVKGRKGRTLKRYRRGTQKRKV